MFAVLVIAACGPPQASKVCTTVRSGGALVSSYDSVLSIALPPGALPSGTEVCIEPPSTRPRPPELYGPAYQVTPNEPLAVPATLYYHHALPEDTSSTGIARIDRSAFESGSGKWAPLDDCWVEQKQWLSRCSETELGLFYGLLDEGGVNNTRGDGDDNADSADTGQGPGPASNATTQPMTSSPDSGPADSGPDDTAGDDTTTGSTIDYPPECDDLAPGPFEPESHGVLFVPILAGNGGGSEDMAADGMGGLVGRQQDTLIRADFTAGFALTELCTPPTELGLSTLGMRFLSNGDLVLAQNTAHRVDLVHPDCSVEMLFDTGPGTSPNGIWIDTEDRIWFAEFNGGRIGRYDRDAGQIVDITTIQSADGILFDPLRGMLFYNSYLQSQVWRVAISPDGNAAGTPTMVIDLSGEDAPSEGADGMAMDVCGNLYVADQGGIGGAMTNGTSRVYRVEMSDSGVSQGVSEIITLPNAQVGSVVWGDGDSATTIFMSGVPGVVYSADVEITSAATATSR